VSGQPWSHLITFDAVCEIHNACIKRFGGDPSSDPTPGCVEGSVGNAWNAELYAGNQEAIEGLCFAGCLLFYLVKNHCFIDGNKRVAWASCMEVLRSLGLTISATDEESDEFCLNVITGGGVVKMATDVCVWLAPRLEALPD
jgi:death-on-curing protein